MPTPKLGKLRPILVARTRLSLLAAPFADVPSWALAWPSSPPTPISNAMLPRRAFTLMTPPTTKTSAGGVPSAQASQSELKVFISPAWALTARAAVTRRDKRDFLMGHSSIRTVRLNIYANLGIYTGLTQF